MAEVTKSIEVFMLLWLNLEPAEHYYKGDKIC